MPWAVYGDNQIFWVNGVNKAWRIPIRGDRGATSVDKTRTCGGKLTGRDNSGAADLPAPRAGAGISTSQIKRSRVAAKELQ